MLLVRIRMLRDKIFVAECTSTYCGELGMKSVKPVSDEKLSRDFLRIGFLRHRQTRCGLNYSCFYPEIFRLQQKTWRRVIDFIPNSKLKFHRNRFLSKLIFILITSSGKNGHNLFRLSVKSMKIKEVLKEFHKSIHILYYIT